MHGSQDVLIPMVLFFVVGLLIFLVIRAFMLWYWKINIIVDRLDRILAALEKSNISRS
jgi:hypothetical protein